MGIQDRDYWRERSRATPSPFAALRATWRGTPAWVIWIVVIFFGTIGVKFAIDLRTNAVPFPPTGQAHWYIDHPAEPLAALTIVAPRTPSSQFVVRLDHWESRQPIVLIPVRGNETAKVSVPLGLYRVTIVKGSLWRGPAKLFGSLDSEAKEAVQPLSFHKIGNTITGHVIKLETLTGNMETKPSRLGY